MRTFLVAICLAVRPGTVTAQGPLQLSSVTGYVWTSQNTPLPGAAVVLRNVDSGAISMQTLTDASDAFSFVGVRAGRYVVELTRAGEPPVMMAVGNPFTLRAGETVATFVRVAVTRPLLIRASSPTTVGAAMSWSRDMTSGNRRMPGGTIEFGVPVGPGQWVVVEAGVFRNRYPNPAGDAATVSRGVISVAARLGSRNRHGVFGQVGAGLWMQRSNPVGRTSAGRQELHSDDAVFTVGPAIGVAAPLGKRLSLSALAEVQLMPQTPRHRWVHVKLSTGLTLRIARD